MSNELKQCPLCGVWCYGYEDTIGFHPEPHNCHGNITDDGVIRSKSIGISKVYTNSELEYDRLRKAVERHRHNRWGEGPVTDDEDWWLYAALQEAGDE